MRTNQSNGFVKVSEAARRLGVSPSSIRRLVDRGELDCRRSNGHPSCGHRLISSKSLAHWMGEDILEGDAEKEIGGGGSECSTVIYARVSGSSQNIKNKDGETSISRQIERIEKWVKDTHQLEGLKVYKDVAKSAFGNRDALNSLVMDIVGGKGIRRVILETMNRLSGVSVRRSSGIFRVDFV